MIVSILNFRNVILVLNFSKLLGGCFHSSGVPLRDLQMRLVRPPF